MQMGTSMMRRQKENFPESIVVSIYRPFGNTLRDLSEIRGEGGRNRGGGHNFLSLRKGRGHEKWAVREGHTNICQ